MIDFDNNRMTHFQKNRKERNKSKIHQFLLLVATIKNNKKCKKEYYHDAFKGLIKTKKLISSLQFQDDVKN
jgi:hypothetical protein